MRRNLLKRKIALGLSLLMLGSSEGVQVLAESVEWESTMQAEESAWEESSALEVYNENTEAETEEKYLETSEQITELDESKLGVEETTHQENTTVETIEREAEATTIETATATDAEYTSGDEQNSAEQNSNELSSEVMPSTEVETELSSEITSSAELETELSSEATSQIEADTEIESENESEYESETEELMSEEETEGDAYLADSLMYGDYQYQIEENGEATITKYYGTDEKVVVPDTIDGHVVTTLADRAFEYNSCIEKVILPDKIVKIKGYIFCNCTSLKEIVIPKSVTEIGESAFSGCTALTKVIFEEQSMIKEISRMMFNGCIALEKIINLPMEITKIGYYAFAECKSLKNIELPESLQYIDMGAFKKSGLELECLDIPKNVYGIGNEAFSEIYVKKILLEPGKEIYIGSGAFESCNELEQIDMNNRSVELAEEAFAGCSSLTEIDLSSVTKIEACAFKGTQIKSLTIPAKTVLEGQFAYGATYYGPFTGCDTLKTVILGDGRTWITRYTFSSSKSIETIVIPASVVEIETFAFWGQGNADNLIIYGIPGSYAEEYAKNYNYQFRDVSEGFEDSYKTSEYLVKVIDSASKQPISGASICLNGEQVGTTLEDGTAKVTVYGTVTQSVTVTKDGYADYSSVGMPWRSTEQNIVELTVQEDAIKDQIMNMLPDVKLPQSTLNGPKITIFGNEVDLFSLPISAEIGWFDKVSFKYDNKKQTVKIMIGVKDSVKKEFEKGDSADEKYKKIKNLVKACALGDDQSDTLDKFNDVKDDLEDTDTSVVFDVSGKVAGFIEFKYENGQWNLLDGGLVTVLSAKASQKVPICYIFYSEFALSGTVTGTIKLTLNNQKMYEIIGSLELAVAPSIALGANALVVDVKGGFEGEIKGKLTFPATTMEEAFEASMSGKLFIKVSSPIPFYTAKFNWELFNIQLYPDFGANLEPVEWKMAVEDRVVPSDGQAYEYANTQIVTLSDGRSVKVYITDDGTKTTGNHTTLMYSVCTNGVWSEAKPVCETGRADVKPVLRADGDMVYVVWMNI